MTIEAAAAGVDAVADPQAERIGARIRRLRHARSLTLVQLADLAELSHPFLSQLERGLARPSIASLEKIARALGSSQLELLADTADEAELDDPVCVVRAVSGTTGHYAEGEARMLVTGRRPFHPMELRGSNPDFGDAFSHQEGEFLTVVSGRIEVDLGANGCFVLDAGDSLYYAGGTPHRWRSLAPGGYRLFIVKEHPARL